MEIVSTTSPMAVMAFSFTLVLPTSRTQITGRHLRFRHQLSSSLDRVLLSSALLSWRPPLLSVVEAEIRLSTALDDGNPIWQIVFLDLEPDLFLGQA